MQFQLPHDIQGFRVSYLWQFLSVLWHLKSTGLTCAHRGKNPALTMLCPFHCNILGCLWHSWHSWMVTDRRSSFDKVPLSFTGFSLYFRTSPKPLARSTRACRVDLSALVWSPCMQPGSHSRQLAFLGSRSKLRSCSSKALALASPLAMCSSLRLTSFLHLGFDSKCHLFQEVLPDFPCTKVPPSSLCHSIWFCYFTDIL